MTEVTEEARAELAAIKAALNHPVYEPINEYQEQTIMLALDKHHNRTPPDPMVAKAENIRRDMGWTMTDELRCRFVAALKRMFPDG